MVTPIALTRLTRRRFLAATAGAAAASVICPRPSTASSGSARSCEVFVYGATPGGIAAAVAAARLGRRVILADHYDHIGGILSNGLTNADIHKKQAVGGLFYEFTRRVVRHYQAQDAANPVKPNVKLCRDGYYFEANLAEQVFHDMIGGEGSRIELLLNYEVVQADVVDGRLKRVGAAAVNQSRPAISTEAGVFIDATYEGDLAAKAGAPFHVGRESRAEYGEPHAGRIYTHFGNPEALAGSTGEADNAIQAFCFRFHVTNDAAKRVPIEKPKDYRREDYRFVVEDIAAGRITKFEQIIQVYPMPNGRFELNSNHCDPKTGVPSQSLDLAEENFDWPEATLARREEIYHRYLSHNVGLIWLLQNDPTVPAAIQHRAREFGWHKDEWPDNGNVPRQVYVRQGRRILGRYILTEKDGRLDPEMKRTHVQPTSVGVLEFDFDSHACHAYDPAHPGVREGYFFVAHEPLQVPYGVIVPQKPGGLLVAVACSASHVGYNALRMEPVFMALGEACGIAAHLAIEKKVGIEDVPMAELQRILVARGGVIAFFTDIPFDDPDFAAFQWLGARGMNPGYAMTPDAPITRADGLARLRRVLSDSGSATRLPASVDGNDTPLQAKQLRQWLGMARYTPAQSEDVAGGLTVRSYCRLVYQAIAAEAR
jgi:hypothetical protein